MRRRKTSTLLELNASEQQLIDNFTTEIMTDEESGTDEGSLVACSVMWRLPDVDKVRELLDAGYQPDESKAHKRRMTGLPRQRKPSNKVYTDLIDPNYRY